MIYAVCSRILQAFCPICDFRLTLSPMEVAITESKDSNKNKYLKKVQK